MLPAEEAYAPLIDVRKRTLLIGLISLVVTAALMWLVIRRLLAPLEHLHRTVRQLAMQPTAVSDLPVRRDDEIGELAGSFAEVLHQLSEREAALKAAKDRAAASEKRIEAIANHVPDFVAFIDVNERFAFVNQAYARHFGLPADQVAGLSLRELWAHLNMWRMRPTLRRPAAAA